MPPDEQYLTDKGGSVTLADEVARAAQVLFSTGSVDETLMQVVHLTVATIEGCDYAGMTLVEQDGRVVTPAHTDPIVGELDALQHRLGEGPSVDAVIRRQAVYAEDLGDSGQWPRFGPEATAMGTRSLLALPLLAEGTRGILSVYARHPSSFGVFDRARGLLLAGLAGVAVGAARTHEDEDRRAANLTAALVTREVIGQAQGILIERDRVTPDQAFDILRRASQHLNVKLRDVAQTLVDTGEDPDVGSTRRA